jgi:hypothetical protein
MGIKFSTLQTAFKEVSLGVEQFSGKRRRVSQ